MLKTYDTNARWNIRVARLANVRTSPQPVQCLKLVLTTILELLKCRQQWRNRYDRTCGRRWRADNADRNTDSVYAEMWRVGIEVVVRGAKGDAITPRAAFGHRRLVPAPESQATTVAIASSAG